MPFVQDNSVDGRDVLAGTIVGSSGSLSSKIAIVGEAPGKEEARNGVPFVGPAGTVLEQCMHSAGLIRANCYITNVIKEKPFKNNLDPYFWTKQNGTCGFTDRGQVWVERLREELKACQANVIVTLGKPAAYALLNRADIVGRKGIRGYVFESTLVPGKKVIPSIHPAATLYGGKYIWRFYIQHDLLKASVESEYPELRIPDLKYHVPVSIDEIEAWCKRLNACSQLSVDIECSAEITWIGFGISMHETVQFWINPSWSETDELRFWRAVATVLENPGISKILQNAMFDIPFLAQRNGIFVRGHIDDTMIMHHIIYPDFEKSLNFIGSVYSNRPYWKNLLKGTTAKKEE